MYDIFNNIKEAFIDYEIAAEEMIQEIKKCSSDGVGNRPRTSAG